MLTATITVIGCVKKAPMYRTANENGKQNSVGKKCESYTQTVTVPAGLENKEKS